MEFHAIIATRIEGVKGTFNLSAEKVIGAIVRIIELIQIKLELSQPN